MRNESAPASRRRGKRLCSRRWRRGRRRSPTGWRRRARHSKTTKGHERTRTRRRTPWTSTFQGRARANLRRLEPRVPTKKRRTRFREWEIPSRRLFLFLRGVFPGTPSPSAFCAATTVPPGSASVTNTEAPVSVIAGWPGGRGRSRRAPAARARGGRRRILFASKERRKKKPNALRPANPKTWTSTKQKKACVLWRTRWTRWSASVSFR
mmetsp:Transcript_10247/g.43559  ORF Transcript_10247/g.43559 Transcript_10247/m.43559 type:complete len:209 (+) Transcript_10247:1299-1925(+)